MLIDIGFLVLMILAIFKGISKGFIVAVFSFFAFYIGLAAALKLSAIVAEYLHQKFAVNSYWLPLLSFAIVFIGVVLLVRVGSAFIKKIAGIVMLGWVDSLAGIALFAILYLMIYSVVLFYATQIHLISADVQAKSTTYFFIEPLGPKVIGFMGKVFPFFSNMFTELSTFFEGVSRKT